MNQLESTSTNSVQQSDTAQIAGTARRERRLSRRMVIGGAVTAGVGLAALAAETGFGQQVTPPVETPTPSAAGAATAAAQSSPVATPGASPAATPAGTPAPTATLKIVTDQRPTPVGSPKTGGELRLFVGSDSFGDFNPTAFRQDFQIPLSYLDPLLWADAVTMEPEPWLAESWKWKTGGKELTITLRQDVTWHDGSALTADDVVFSFDVYQNDYDSAAGRLFSAVDNVKATSKHVVTVTFDQPDGAFVFNACTLPIFQKAQYEKLWTSQTAPDQTLSGFDWSKHPPVGTGPWKIDKISANAVSFAANDDYWAGRPYADRLVLTVEDDKDARLDAWKAGKVDVVYPVAPADAISMLYEQGTLYVAESPTVFFAAFNFNNPANATADMMKDPALRQALTLAVDREAYGHEIFLGFIATDKAGTITQPWAHDSSITNPSRDVAKAKKLLADGGWADVDGDGMLEDANGNKLDLYCVVSTAERPELLALLDGLNANFQEIGAHLTVQQLDPLAFVDRWVSNHMFDMAAFSLTQYPAFAEFDLYGTAWDVRTNATGWNSGGYSNEVVDAAITDWLRAYEIDDMKAALIMLQEASNRDLFGLWFGFPQELILVREHIQGYHPNKMWQTWDTRLLWDDQQTANATPAATPKIDATPAG